MNPDFNTSDFWNTELGKLYKQYLTKKPKTASIDSRLIEQWSNFTESKPGLVTRSSVKGKKFRVVLRDGKVLNFGAKGYTIGAAVKPNKGQDFCSRSWGQNPGSDEITPWLLSQMTWQCRKGKLDGSLPQLKLGDNIYDDKFKVYFNLSE